MERIVRLRPVVAPSAIILTVGGLVGLLILSFVFQPPYESGADSTERLLGWARAGLFTGGALAFVAGLALALRGTAERPSPMAFASRSASTPAKPLPALFTLVALGRTADDTRAITDAASASDAVRLLCSWSAAYPDEHIIIFDMDAEPVAFRRPERSDRRA